VPIAKALPAGAGRIAIDIAVGPNRGDLKTDASSNIIPETSMQAAMQQWYLFVLDGGG